MAVDEARRRELFEALSELLGDEVTATLFEHLPPSGRGVATARQVHELGEELRGEMQEGFHELGERLQDLDSRLGEVDSRLQAQGVRFQEQQAQLEARLTGNLKAAWRREMLLHSSSQFFALVAAVAALVAFG